MQLCFSLTLPRLLFKTHHLFTGHELGLGQELGFSLHNYMQILKS